MKSRSELRDVIIKVLYQTYIYDNSSIKYDINDLIKEQLEIENEFVNNSIKGIKENESNINDIANKYLKNWSIDRLSKVDKAILSLGIYELLYTDTPDIVCINEAIILAKLYSDDDVKNMINGILDKIYKNKVEEHE